ncbi:MAG: SDR family NAD(P)-dependent oxidoreductase [Gammaproteobacteria bacterium]|nr:SDR family NAD(P)-dependent oxidoreductase [Gammaproteobacteria bacterium]MBT4494954.1 SDR family NAD(P)-dependent oxidoreductase [Gammaproteobacteria bacterium]
MIFQRRRHYTVSFVEGQTMKDVAGRVAFITGGASGLGLAMAQSFTGAGMKVAIADVEDAALESTRQLFDESNAEVITMKVDVTDRDAMEEARQQTLAAFGKVHVVCNNAGVALNDNIAEMTYKNWDWVMKVNLDGVINGIVTFMDDIRSHGEGGHFVNTASIAGQYGMPNLSAYCGSKFAVVGISESMRIDLADDNIGVSVLCPGFVETGIYKSERNRPAAFGGNVAPAMKERPDGAVRIVDGQEMQTMQPSAIGDIVLHAIQNEQFYILTHSEFESSLTKRAQEIQDSFAYWQNYREKHNV